LLERSLSIKIHASFFAVSSQAPAVTVCVPTIGRMAYLPVVRKALAEQTFRDFEVLVLDNDSPADAATWLQAWASEVPNVRVVRQSPRIPMFNNFDRGIAAAKGEFLTYVHDDDLYLPTYLEAHVKELRRHASAVFSGANFGFIDEAGALTELRTWIPKTELWNGKRYIAELICRGRNVVAMPGLMFRTSVFQNKRFDADLSPYFGDFVLLARMAERGDVAMMREPVMHVRRHQDQASLGFPASEWPALRRKTLLDYCGEYEQRHPNEAAFVRRMKRAQARNYRIALLGGFLRSEEQVEAFRCLEQLKLETLPDRAVVKLLTGLERSGARRYLRGLVSRDALHTVARLMRI
jgi:glycosyltransferase involved in cell wall biosynthesis